MAVSLRRATAAELLEAKLAAPATIPVSERCIRSPEVTRPANPAFTKRRCAESNASPVSERFAAIRGPELTAIVREICSGRALAVAEFASVSRAGDFSTFHCSEELATATLETAPFDTGNTPCCRFVAVLPGASVGCDGTMPTVPVLEWTQVTVAGLHPAPANPPPPTPGDHSQPIPGWNSHPP